MKQVVENPFRVLGLPVSATDRQVAKVVTDAAAYFEMGKPFKVEGDYAWMPPITRTLEMLRKAQADLHRPEDRCYYAMFWFLGHDSVDQLALDMLQTGDLAKTTAILAKPVSISNLINFYVLNLAVAASDGPRARESFLAGFATAGRVLSAGEGLESFLRKLQWERLDRQRMVNDLSQEALRLLAGSGSASLLAMSSEDIWKLFATVDSFPKEARLWFEGRFEDQFREALEAALLECKEGRENLPEDALESARDLLSTSGPLLEKLRVVLRPSDPRVATFCDQVAGELLQCSIAYHNHVLKQDEEEELALEPAVEMVKLADGIAMGAVTKGRIRRDLPVIANYAAKQSQRKRVARPAKEIFALLDTLPKASQVATGLLLATGLLPDTVQSFLEKVTPLLRELSLALAEDREEYIKISTIVVQVSLSLLIAHANHARSTLDVLRPLQLLASFDMDAEARARFDANRRTAQENARAVSRVNAPPASSSSRCYVATCVYGSSTAPEVVALRRYRDAVLQKSLLGRAFVFCYYRISPPLIPLLSRLSSLHPPLRWAIRNVAARWGAGPESTRRSPTWRVASK